MSNPYEQNLAKNPANYQQLTPLTFLSRSAVAAPNHTAIIHGNTRISYAEFYARCRRLGSALAMRGIGPGDTVSVMLANTPPMLDAHYGVAMTGAVVHTINTRLDAAIVAFQLDHADTKLLIVDREFSETVRAALALTKVKPIVIDYNDREFPQTGEPLSDEDYEAFIAKGDPAFDWRWPARRMGCDLAQLHIRHDGKSEGRRLSSSRRGADVLREYDLDRHDALPRLSVDAADVPLQRLVFPVVGDAGARHARLPSLGARQGDVRRHRRA